MKEQDYIDVRDLSNLIHGYNCLGEICPGNQPNIPEKEYKAVMEQLWRWKERMFAVVEEKTDLE